ncbi:glycerophosphotransferase [Bacillus sp. BB51/4]|uniref:CDP-glycerol glycerophosphotransferase family protein n=1 Tax=Bacillus cereus group TaxID=86661 RepID=UPI000B4B2F42|nr:MULTISPECIES: CDP-glycerol glycerophosphotransferase family protein [Bacillus cereus group]KAA0776565.1 glycerophosphotransferase [Bacillus sp. BB51/4]TCD32313.1 glycerophosphotransferase [Bacillus wiedmannii]
MGNVILKKDFKKTIFNILKLPLYILSSLIPKKSNLIVLGSSKGQHFADNSKYLYLYLKDIEEKKVNELDFYWITKNKELANKYSSDKRFIYGYTLKGMYVLLRARIAILTHSIEDLPSYLMGRKKIIQLWHGTPLKKIGYDADSWNERGKIKNSLKKAINKLFPYMDYMKCNYLVVASDQVKDSFETAFKISKDKMITLGQPRNDLFEEGKVVDAESRLAGYQKIISWLPTHRGFSDYTIVDLLKDYKFNEAKINEFLKKKKYLLVIKPHFVEKGELSKYLKGSSNILVYDEADPYPLLTKSEILITDYSSIFFDYMLTDKKIIFAPFDYEFYTKKVANLYYDYKDIVCGDICLDWEEICDHLDSNGENSTKYKSIKRIFNKYDFGNCERVYEFIKKI